MSSGRLFRLLGSELRAALYSTDQLRAEICAIASFVILCPFSGPPLVGKKETSKINKCIFFFLWGREISILILELHPFLLLTSHEIKLVHYPVVKVQYSGAQVWARSTPKKHKNPSSHQPRVYFFCQQKMAKDHVFSLIASLWWWRSLDHKVVVAHIFFLCSWTWQNRRIKKSEYSTERFIYVPAELLQPVACSD